MSYGWKKAALRLARAIIRFQNNDYKYAMYETTVEFAHKLTKEASDAKE